MQKHLEFYYICVLIRLIYHLFRQKYSDSMKRKTKVFLLGQFLDCLWFILKNPLKFGSPVVAVSGFVTVTPDVKELKGMLDIPVSS